MLNRFCRENCLTRGTSWFGVAHPVVLACAEKTETRTDWLLGMMMLMSRFDVAMTGTKRSNKDRSFNSEAEERDKSVA